MGENQGGDSSGASARSAVLAAGHAGVAEGAETGGEGVEEGGGGKEGRKGKCKSKGKDKDKGSASLGQTAPAVNSSPRALAVAGEQGQAAAGERVEDGNASGAAEGGGGAGDAAGDAPRGVDGRGAGAADGGLGGSEDGMMTSWYAIAEKAEIAASVVEESNFVAAAQPGCHVAFHDADWIVGVDDFEPEDLGLRPDEDPPDLSLDPEEALLSVVNTSRTLDKAFFITIYHPAVNGLEEDMAFGTQRAGDGHEAPCITLVLVVRPRQIMDVCWLELPKGKKGKAKGKKKGKGGAGPGPQPQLRSIVNDVLPHPDPRGLDEGLVLPFPLGGPGPFLCSQAAFGKFTHFYPNTLHAVDLQCPVGTPVLAVGDAVVVGVEQTETVGGIRCVRGNVHAGIAARHLCYCRCNGLKPPGASGATICSPGRA